MIQSCNLFNSDEEDREPVARAYDRYLYADELAQNIPNSLSDEDSTVMAHSLIKNWIEKQILVYQAESNLPGEKKNVEKKLEEYRNDLLIYTYQNELLNQKLDTTVTEAEIKTYYQNNKKNFQLKDYIIKVYYVKVDTNAPRVDELKSNILADDTESLRKVEDYCYQFAHNFYLDENKWLYLDDILKEIPVEDYNREKFLRKNKIFELEHAQYKHILRVLNYRLKDSTSPLSLEHDKIKSIILNQRKVEFIKNLKGDLFAEAERKNNFEIY